MSVAEFHFLLFDFCLHQQGEIGLHETGEFGQPRVAFLVERRIDPIMVFRRLLDVFDGQVDCSFLHLLSFFLVFISEHGLETAMVEIAGPQRL